MNGRSKSASIRRGVVLFCVLALSACADSQWPTWLTGEPGASVLNAPRVVGTPPSHADKSFPNLATVPEKPKDFSKIPDVEKQVERMKSDKIEAEVTKQRLENTPMPPPLGAAPTTLPLQPLGDVR
ncbi:MAG: hypothetical protein HGA90_07415 [Alphaproteobacteria bacterium]|nr:hypothetical protein [Alphaproteobacteria bacterium]